MSSYVGGEAWGRALERMGYEGLLDGMAKVPVHPDHCQACKEARLLTDRELRQLQDAAYELIGRWAGRDFPEFNEAVRLLRKALGGTDEHP